MFHNLNNEKGFSLIEVILSIAALSIISIFVLQMFVVSAEANKKAKNMDIAASKATSVIELYQIGKHIPSVIYYDSEWNEISTEKEADAQFILYFDTENIEESMEMQSIQSFSSASKEITYTDNAVYDRITVRVIDTSIKIESKMELSGYTAVSFRKGGGQR